MAEADGLIEWLEDEATLSRVSSEGEVEGHELFSSGKGRRRRIVAVRHPRGERNCAIARLVGLFADWQQEAPSSARVVTVADPPQALIELGQLRAVWYRSSKWGRRAPRGRDYLHEFESPRPVLAADDQERLHVVGGAYRITSDGIEG